MEHDNIQHKERAKTYRANLQALEDDVYKARNEKNVNEKAMEKEIDKLRMKVDEQELAIEALKDELSEDQKNNKKALVEKDTELKEVKEELAEALENGLDFQGGSAAGSSRIGKGYNDGPNNHIKSMAIIPKEKLKELEGHQARMTTLKTTNEKMAKDLKERTEAVKDLTGQLAVNGDELDKKLLENRRLREELEVRITQESKEFKKLGKAKKIVNDLKLELDTKSRIIKQLNQQIEILEAKLLKMAKLFDKQRSTINKNDQSMRLNHLYATKLYGNRALSPTFNQDKPTSVREFSPLGVRYPAAPASDYKRMSYAPEYTRERSPEDEPIFNTKDMNTLDFGTCALENQEKIATYGFVKANTADYISPYLFREDNKLMVAGQVKSTGKYEKTSNGGFINQRPYHFKKLFTQFELEAMSEDLASYYTGEKILAVVYGTPLNIKLFIILKMILALFTRISASVRDGGSFDLQFMLQSKYAKVMTDYLESIPAIDKDNDYAIRVFKEGEDLMVINLRSTIPLMLEHCKKFFYDMLTQSTAPGFFFINIEVQYKFSSSRRDGESPSQSLTIMRSQVQSVNSSLSYKDCFQSVIGNCPEPSVTKFTTQQAQLANSKLFFLVLEPGKVSSYEESLALLDIHLQLDKHRVQPKSYDRVSASKRSGSSQPLKYTRDIGEEIAS